MGAGSSHVGSPRAANMVKDERSAAFEAIVMDGLKSLAESEQVL